MKEDEKRQIAEKIAENLTEFIGRKATPEVRDEMLKAIKEIIDVTDT